MAIAFLKELTQVEIGDGQGIRRDAIQKRNVGKGRGAFSGGLFGLFILIVRSRTSSLVITALLVFLIRRRSLLILIRIRNLISSGILGDKGNREFLLHLEVQRTIDD